MRTPHRPEGLRAREKAATARSQPRAVQVVLATTDGARTDGVSLGREWYGETPLDLAVEDELQFDGSASRLRQGDVAIGPARTA